MENQDAFLEKIILFLVVLVGAMLIFNQFQFSKLMSSGLNALAFLLILILIGSIIWLLISKQKEQSAANYSKHKEKMPWTFYEKTAVSLIAIVTFMVFLNQFAIADIGNSLSGKSSSSGSFLKAVSKPLKLMGATASGKEGTIIGPMLNTDGRTTRLVEWPTISQTPAPQDTGNPSQDAITTVIPTGTPFYVLEGPGSEKIQGISFDDPITSQKVWATLLGSKRFGTANAIELTPEEQERWDKMTSIFTCDYCCGGPNSVTTINRCGCAHSYAWQGMAKFFIKHYPEYTDEQIMGEMTKWKGLWYPKGMVQDYLVFTGQQPASILTHGGSTGIKQQFMQQGNQPADTQASVESLDELQGMVGGC